ncbi:MAG: MarR family winged helix-turn-helix transcriptional regulator [Desulfovibrionaceae bacterium]
MSELNPSKTGFLDAIGCHDRQGGHKLGLTCYEISRGWRVLMDQRLRHLGLSSSRWVVIFALADLARPVSQKELADAIGVEGPSVVHILDHLQKEGWVRRRVSPKDRRVKLVELSDRAQTELSALMVPCLELEEEILADIDPDELDRCHRLLLRLRARIAQLGDSGGPSVTSED